MAELRKCSRCTSTMEIKYFAINRKGDHYKCCDRCRGYTQKYVSNNKEKTKEMKHAYWINHKDEIHNKREELKKLAEESNGMSYYCNRCYQLKLFDDFVCPNGKTYNACYKCLDIRYNSIRSTAIVFSLGYRLSPAVSLD